MTQREKFLTTTTALALILADRFWPEQTQPPVEPPVDPEPPVEPPVTPDPLDPTQVAALQAEVTAARKRLKDVLDAIAKLKNEGKEVPGYLWRNRDNYAAALTAAKAEYTEYTGEQPTGSDPVMPPVNPTTPPVTPEPEPLPGIAIADRAALDAALAGATGGEVFRLAAGDYGALTIKPNFADPVTITGPRTAKFTSLKAEQYHWQHRGKGITFDGITAGYIGVKGVNNVRVTRCAANQIELASIDNLHVESNWMHDGHFCLRVLRCKFFKVLSNILENFNEDAMRISGDSTDGEVRGNVFWNSIAAMPMHSDCLQIFGLPGEATGPKRMTIEQNLMHDNILNKKVYHIRDGNGYKAGDEGKPAAAQGVFVGDGAGDFHDFSVRHNLIRLPMVNAIATKSGPVNFRVEENIVLNNPGYYMARIRFGKHDDQPNWNAKGVTVSRNIAPQISDESGDATVLNDNFTFGGNVNGLFAGITQEDGNTGKLPEQYRLAANSPVPADLVAPWLEDTIAVIRNTLDTVQRAA